jgi:hypothetical protein
LRKFFSDSEWQEILHSPVHPSDRDYVQAAFEASGRKPDNPADWVFMVIALSHVLFRRDRPGRPPKLGEGPEAIAREFEDTREALRDAAREYLRGDNLTEAIEKLIDKKAITHSPSVIPTFAPRRCAGMCASTKGAIDALCSDCRSPVGKRGSKSGLNPTLRFIPLGPSSG